MKRLMTFILLILSLGLTSCSKYYDDGYNDGYSDGWSDGDYSSGYEDGEYAELVKWAIKAGSGLKIGTGADSVTFVKFGQDDPAFAVYRMRFGGTVKVYAIKLMDYYNGLLAGDSWANIWWGKNNFFYNLTDNLDGTFSCNINIPADDCTGFLSIPPQDIQNMIFEEVTPTYKDLEKAGALIEILRLGSASEALMENFGLSEERSNEVAHLALNWEKASRNRAMTNADAKVFSKELLGADIPSWERAVKKSLQGDSKDYEDLIKRAAKVNGITPEHVYEIINTFMD